MSNGPGDPLSEELSRSLDDAFSFSSSTSENLMERQSRENASSLFLPVPFHHQPSPSPSSSYVAESSSPINDPLRSPSRQSSSSGLKLEHYPVSPSPASLSRPPSSPSPLLSPSSLPLASPVKLDLLFPNIASSPGAPVPQPGTSVPADPKLALEAFLDDETPAPRLSNIPQRHNSATTLLVKPQTPPPAQAKSPLSLLQRDDKGRLIYTITPSDTLEGLSLRFGVKISDLKKANSLFNSRDFCIRKTFVIPLDPVHYDKYRKEQECQSNREQVHRTEVFQLFVEKTGASNDIATLYLTDAHFHLERAMERYHLENSHTTEPLDVRPRSPQLTFSEGISRLAGGKSPSSNSKAYSSFSALNGALRNSNPSADEYFDL